MRSEAMTEYESGLLRSLQNKLTLSVSFLTFRNGVPVMCATLLTGAADPEELPIIDEWGNDKNARRLPCG
jgi:hypothetical protein